MKSVYLDNASTTPLDKDVLDVMMPYLTDYFGNASSVHGIGRKARFAIEDSRERIAAVIGAEPSEIIFTSGGTEADNLALRTLGSIGPVAVAKSEHKAVLAPAKDLDVVWLDTDRHGGLSMHLPEPWTTKLNASVMLVNNETGVINDVRKMADRIHENGGLIHTDAVQAAGLLDLDVERLGVDMMSLSAHKIGGPKGTGVLYVRGGSPFTELITGGSQERGRRGGTENVAGIVGFSTALEKAVADRESWWARCSALRNRLESGLAEAIDVDYVVNSPEGGAPHIYNIAFLPVNDSPIDGEMLTLNMDVAGVCISTGSACTSGAIEPSHVLIAAGVEADTAGASVRMSIGKQNTTDDIDTAVSALAQCIARMAQNHLGRVTG